MWSFVGQRRSRACASGPDGCKIIVCHVNGSLKKRAKLIQKGVELVRQSKNSCGFDGEEDSKLFFEIVVSMCRKGDSSVFELFGVMVPKLIDVLFDRDKGCQQLV